MFTRLFGLSSSALLFTFVAENVVTCFQKMERGGAWDPMMRKRRCAKKC